MMDPKILLGIAAGAAIAIGGLAIAERHAGTEAPAAAPSVSPPAAPDAAAQVGAPAIASTDNPGQRPKATYPNDRAANANVPDAPTQLATAAPADDGYADVRSVHPVVEKVGTPRKVCEDVAVTRRAPGDGNHVVGTVVGAAVGGLLGNQIGRGGGRNAATVAGAVGGGFVGHEVGVRHDANRTTTRTETRCRTVEDSSDKVTAYDVTYEYRGRTYTTRMDHDPGSRMPVETTVAPAATANPTLR